MGDSATAESVGRITVQQAQPKDLDWIVNQLEAFTIFYGSKHSLRGTDEFWRSGLLNMIEKHLFLVAHKGNVPVGLIAGTLSSHPFNPDLNILCESFWWVDPEHRASRAGLMLLDAFLDIGKKHAQWITMALEHNSPVNDRVLEKRGFKLNERSFLLEV